jgi:hypothetical protein
MFSNVYFMPTSFPCRMSRICSEIEWLKLKHCVDEEGRGLRPGVTGRRKVGVKGAATLLDYSFLLYPVLLRPGAGGACCRLRTDPLWDGMTMSRKRLLVEDAGIER